MNEAEQRLAALVAYPPKVRRTAKQVLLASGAVLLTLVALTSFILGITNYAGLAAADRCTASLLSNQDAQNRAGQESRLLLRQAAQQAADSETAKAADILTLLDPLASQELRSAAAADFGDQSTMIASAWQQYVDESEKADKIRAENPTNFKC